MGTYLSTPSTDKEVEDLEGGGLSCGVASMQGWRAGQEDAHCANPTFDGQNAFFAVYDGHGGSEVSKSCGLHLHKRLLQLKEYKDGSYEQALIKAFLDTDQYLLTEEGKAELEALVQQNRKPDENESINSDDHERLSEFVKSLVGRDADELRAMIGAVQRGAKDDSGSEEEDKEGAAENDDNEGEEGGEEGKEDMEEGEGDGKQQEDAEDEKAGSEKDKQSDEEQSGEDEGNSPAFLRRSQPVAIPTDEELGGGPGHESGCTAIAALITTNPSGTRSIVVANAGDSRAVLCRGGKAVDLSTDHSPNLPEERARIKGAGGVVTADGRIQGSLNVARALGDFQFKQNTSLPAERQMVTALPEIQVVELLPEDEFVLIACDGIWNVKTSQQAVDFIRDKLATKPNKLSDVCGALCDDCLAPDTSGDGSGCDNMTVVLVLLQSHGASSSTNNKRNATLDESPIPKRQKVE
eukprot:c18610_g1_i2.p2 GENE.c18610_g1_i2~~c18610_g1_i2.p2  ORF type:complete len:466 (+),score=123.67 c18610_g1_i2:54-1451(+)